MIDRYRKQWEALGTDDPYWAVLTDPGKKNGRWVKEEFFQTGKNEIDGLLKKTSRLGIQLRFDLALDYGCGVGRLSRALSTAFLRVVGVDISEAMLAEARAATAGYDNIQFLRTNGQNLECIADETVDFIYSNIVLQHSPRKNQRLLIKEFCRVLRPRGSLVFQTPSELNILTVKGILHLLLGNRILNIARRIKYGKTCIMEIHTIKKDEVFKILSEEGVALVEAERYDSAGTAFISYRYFCVKS
ncbi:MAG TPA: SAM-dependent methyltransferase [Desulfobulbaceae bacterium]|nr:SAM-dependent methyltransferase [Desulfobulbaceae bacterium]